MSDPTQTDTPPSDDANIDGELAVGRVLRACAITACVIGTVYLLRSPAAPYLLDSSELVATTTALGVSHPPGHPAFHLLGFLWSMLPFGTAAFRVHAFVAMTSAACLGLLPYAAFRLGWLRTRAHVAFASTTAVAIGFAPAFAQQSIRAEVYALNALVAALATVLVLSPKPAARVGNVIALATVLGVGLLNHHLLTVAAFPAFAFGVIAFSATSSRVARLVAGTLTGAGLLAGYLYLPARAAAQPAASWGWPDSLSEVWWILSAQAFQKTAGRAASIDFADSAINVIGVLGESLTLPGLLLAIAGLVIVALRSPRVGWFFALAIVFNLATQVAFGFDPMNPDALGYFMPTYWWLGLGLVFLTCEADLPGRLRAHTGLAQVAFGLLLLTGIALTARSGPRTVSLAQYWDSELLRDEALNGLAPESAWITSYYETGFNTWYAQAVEDRRPDVLHIHQAFLTYDFYREMLAARDDGSLALTAPEDTNLADGRPTGLLAMDALLARASFAEVRIEAEQLVPPALSAHCIPTRLYLQLVPESLPTGRFPASLSREAVTYAAAVAERFPQPLEVQTARNLGWAYFNLAGHLYQAGRLDTCSGVLAQALKLSPNDPDLRGFSAQVNREIAGQ